MTDPPASETTLDDTLDIESAFPPQLEGLLALLSDDERPTFIVNCSASPRIAYRNPALTSFVANGASLEAWVADLPFKTFRSEGPSAVVTAGNFARRTWHSKRIGNGPWAVLYCGSQTEAKVSNDEDITGNDSSRSQEQQTCPRRDYTSPRISEWFFDWIRFPLHTSDSWITFLQNYDWEKTRIGPIQNWPEDLSRLCVYVLSAPDPRVIVWGDDFLCLFNESAKTILSDRYLACLGNPLADGLGTFPVEQDLECLRRNLENGRCFKDINLEYILTRNGLMEEAYFDLHIAPVPGVDGYLAGAVIEFSETTSVMIQQRKEQLTASIFDHMMQAKDLESLWSFLGQGFVTSPKYITFAAVYVPTESENEHSGATYRLHTSAGLDASTLQRSVKLGAGGGLAAAFINVHQNRRIMLLQQKDRTLPQELALATTSSSTLTTVGLLSIESGSPNKQALAFILVGFNPRLYVSTVDATFLSQFRDVIANSAAMMELPAEQRLDQDLERLNTDLARKLQITATQAKKSEDTFTRMARNAPFGMYMFRPDGSPIFVNETWLELCGFSSREELDKVVQSGPFWRDIIPSEDQSYITHVWDTALKSKTPTKIEHRLAIQAKPGDAQSDEPQYRWLEGNSFPDLDEDDNIVAMQGWLIDITDRKKAESLMAQRLDDALETKRASERFIDMVSHEIRNPLSAILQVADGILGTTPASAESTIDAARTIILCAQHQKKIVDDVLVISKLDSNLLVLSPEKSEPPDLLGRALKMHEAEIAQADIKASLHIEQSYKDLMIDSVLLDESRILQVVINLLGNAIKFTRQLETRNITISLAASKEVPTGLEHGIIFASQRSVKRPSVKRSQSSNYVNDPAGHAIYLQVAIKDTGRGLAPADIERIFQRFSQTSPKTYKKYGSSGLGLYISKELAELQGGQIGVRSDGLGKGSTFAFYVRTKRCSGPLLTPSLEASVSVKEFPATRNAGEVDVITKSTMAKVTSKGSTANKKESKTCGLHVLVVEDNAINQKVMAQQLRRIGCTVHVANHGMEALSFLASSNFQRGYTPLSIVLMDIEMPVMDGLTCTRRIRQLENTGEILRRVPIIAVTANARNQQIADALKAGVDEVVTKPFRIPELLPRMEALVEKRMMGGE